MPRNEALSQYGVPNGSIYDAAVHSGSDAYKNGTMPRVGDKRVFEDGREFVFISSAVDVLAGQVLATATALATALTNSCTAAAIGATSVTITTTGSAFFGGSAGVIAANRLAGGYLCITDDAGEGYQYRIKSHTAGTASASVTFTLYDGLVVALTTASDVFFIGPRYELCVLGTDLLPPVGIAMVAATGGTNTRTEYFWVQTKGIAPCYITTGTSIAIGKQISTDASGGVKITGAATDVMIGVAAATSTTATAKLPVLLNIGG